MWKHIPTGGTVIEWQIHLSWSHYCYCLDDNVLSNLIFVSSYLVKQSSRISPYTFQPFFSLLQMKPFLLSCLILILIFPTIEESVLPDQCNEQTQTPRKSVQTNLNEKNTFFFFLMLYNSLSENAKTSLLAEVHEVFPQTLFVLTLQVVW